MKYSVLIAIIDSLDPEVLDMASDPVFKQSNKSSDHLNMETRACCVISRSKLKLVYDNERRVYKDNLRVKKKLMNNHVNFCRKIGEYVWKVKENIICIVMQL